MGKIDQDLFLDKLVKAGLLGSKSPDEELRVFVRGSMTFTGTPVAGSTVFP